MSDDKDRCGNCHFFVDHGQVSMHGQCRRFPPSIPTEPSPYHAARQGGSFHGDRPARQIGWAAFPQVHENYWCGEHKRAEAKREDHA